ncbi:hypothetical protein CA54_09380 [Symmachiella macrocystis]|uniref:Uncharacterized protein n=1 Tax=Symmachiella macrocystis TaxID=2527985 RepID=A0A5C6BJD1_9PLAN|nr:hypothetical protein CA54_09380 [Symmachiella macrocystis]
MSKVNPAFTHTVSTGVIGIKKGGDVQQLGDAKNRHQVHRIAQIRHHLLLKLDMQKIHGAPTIMARQNKDVVSLYPVSRLSIFHLGLASVDSTRSMSV